MRVESGNICIDVRVKEGIDFFCYYFQSCLIFIVSVYKIKNFLSELLILFFMSRDFWEKPGLLSESSHRVSRSWIEKTSYDSWGMGVEEDGSY